MQREILVSPAETNNELLLEVANDMLGRIAAVDTRRDLLVVGTLIGHSLLGNDTGLIIQVLKLEPETNSSETSMDDPVCMKDAQPSVLWRELSQDTVAIKVIKH